MKNPCESLLKEKCTQRTPLFGGHIVVYVICRLHIHIGTIIVRAGVECWMSGVVGVAQWVECLSRTCEPELVLWHCIKPGVVIGDNNPSAQETKVGRCGV